METPTEQNQVIFSPIQTKMRIPEYMVYFIMAFLFLALATYYNNRSHPAQHFPVNISVATAPLTSALKSIKAASFSCASTAKGTQAILTTYDTSFTLYDKKPKSEGGTFPRLDVPCPSSHEFAVTAEGSSSIIYIPNQTTTASIDRDWEGEQLHVKSLEIKKIADYLLMNSAYFEFHENDGSLAKTRVPH
jgi:hypothetical protein